jgi:cbb3-type cytochrome oxidase cytochrome c subunit
MKTGFSVFLASLAAIGASWCGLVLAPALQLGGAGQQTVLNGTDTYPIQHTGDATLGLQVYRANGCAACHTEQIRQTGTVFEINLTGLGVYKQDAFTAFVRSLFVLPELAPYTNAINASLNNWSGELPKPILISGDKAIASEMADRLKAVGVKSEMSVLATGADIFRGWGTRQSVAADYLYDQPVQLGSLRAGPDLANIGVRMPDLVMQLKHLYAPKSVAKDSTMPAFRYLFELRKTNGSQASPDALNLTGEFAPPAGFEIVPTADAKNLAAYLVSLKASAPLFEAPFTP